MSIRLVNFVLEELRWALEHHNYQDQQRTITCARLLGVWFCRTRVPGKLLVIDQVYYDNLGHTIPPALREASINLVRRVDEQQQQHVVVVDAVIMTHDQEFSKYLESRQHHCVKSEPYPTRNR